MTLASGIGIFSKLPTICRSRINDPNISLRIDIHAMWPND
jgi:hypothetical protein